MAYEVTMPRLGWDMEEGALGSWLKKDGDFVNAGDLLFTVEGDKAVQEIEAFERGYLRIAPNVPAAGEKVPVGTILGYIVSKEEFQSFNMTVPSSTQSASVAADARGSADSPIKPGSPTPISGGHAVEWPGRRVYISPYARRLAEGLGIDWQKVTGSGLGGRIMAADIHAAIQQKNELSAIQTTTLIEDTHPRVRETTSSASPAAISRDKRVPMSAVRRSIADNMLASARTTAAVTLNCEVDATQLASLRSQLKEDLQAGDNPVPSYNDMLAKIAAQALLEHPEMNARIDGDDIVYYSSAHVAIAVDTERGLLVPVLRDVQTKSLLKLAQESTTLIEKTRQGKAAYDDFQGGTFTITNLGMYEIETFTPIINLPQAAILGVGQILPKQVVVDAEQERVVIQQRMSLSLTFDHRLVDGAKAARFLQRIKRLIEKPFLWLAG
jgi:pyruvate dehydrogenase E2 component (dihydrolipoamide acetyltransferase)